MLQNCTYSPSLVALAFLVACLAGYTALDMVERVGNSLSHPHRWQWVGAFCLGSGIWATHFVAMLAFHAPIALRYDLPITGLSLLIAVAASYLAMYDDRPPRASACCPACSPPAASAWASLPCTTPGWRRCARWPPSTTSHRCSPFRY
ncbi:MHYT domain-containing protein [Pseudomonas aeruginosa]|nr:MHYT domain-containing protein [Pseudomonas aeruginosa]